MHFSSSAVVFLSLVNAAMAQLNVLTVDCTPLVSPFFSSFGATNTMGMSVQQVDQGGEFAVTEVTPQAFRAMTVLQLQAYDVIAINNHPRRISDNCVLGSAGLGITWHNAIGVTTGGRIVLSSHDAARFKIIIPPGATGAPPGPGVEPYGADDIVRNAVLWAGGGQQTGLVIFNDSARFFSVLGNGWDNLELNLPAAWLISDLDQSGGFFKDGGYTAIVPAFASHPLYAGISDARYGINSVSSFQANIVDQSFHSIFNTFANTIFTPTEVTTNIGIIDVGGFNQFSGKGVNLSPPGPNGKAITLIRDCQPTIVCPADVEADNSYGLLCGADVSYEVTVTCDLTPDIDCGAYPEVATNEFFGVGETTIYCSATFDSGALANCNFKVIVEDIDSDGDGVEDCDDQCPDTLIPEDVPTEKLLTNRWALTDDGDGFSFDTTPPKGKGPGRSYTRRTAPTRSYTIEDTSGCSCKQIIEYCDYGEGHTKFGCSISVMDAFASGEPYCE